MAAPVQSSGVFEKPTLAPLNSAAPAGTSGRRDVSYGSARGEPCFWQLAANVVGREERIELRCDAIGGAAH